MTPAVTGALLAGLLWCVAGINVHQPQPDRVALFFAGMVLVWIRRPRLSGPLVCLYALSIAVVERWSREPHYGSDVLRATREAIETVLMGMDPYAHVLQSTFPVGSPLVYPPGEFLFYLPSYLAVGDIDRVDSITGVLSVGLIALAGLKAGWDRVSIPAMLYATWGIGALHAIDGSNDVSAAFLVTLGLVALVFADPHSRSGRAAFVVSAVALGWAVAFKQFAVVIVPLVIRHVAVSGREWRRFAAISVGTAAFFILPFLLWDPQAFVSQQLGSVTFHQDPHGISFLNVLRRYVDVEPLYPIFFALEVIATLIGLVIALRTRLPTIGVAALAGCALVVVALLFARWSTQTYYVYVGAVACAAFALVDRSARSAENLESPR